MTLERMKPVTFSLLGGGVWVAAEALRAVDRGIGSAAGLVLLIAYACLALPRLRGPIYPSVDSLDLRDRNRSQVD
jgi:hypothetical protein